MSRPLKIVATPVESQRVFADLCVRDTFFCVQPSAPASLCVKTDEVMLREPTCLVRNALELDTARLVGFDPDQPVWQVDAVLTWERCV